MHFPLKVDKAVQAIGVVFRADGVSRMNYMRLLKLLYIADREALVETGKPITGGPVVAMERGPVLQEVYELVRGQHRRMPLWDQYLRRNRYDLELVKDSDVVLLSRYEIGKLQQIAERYSLDDEWALSLRTHEFAEWKKNQAGASSRPIPLRDTLEAVGLGDAAEQIMSDAQETCRMERLLGV